MDSWFTPDALRNLLLTFPVFLFSLVFHECAHAWMGLRRGDDLAYRMGRLTLNPLPHIDPIGTILLPVLMMLRGTGFMFGWAKPVPVNPRTSSKDMMFIAAAGPLSNMLLVPLFAVVAFGLGKTLGPDPNPTLLGVYVMACAGIKWNVILAAFNLLPIPPLDGSKIVYYFLPSNLRQVMRSAERYSFILFLVIIFTPLGWIVFFPIAIIVGVFDLVLPLGMHL